MGNLKNIISNKEKLCGIYKMYFDENNIYYIGSSADLYQRAKNHLSGLKNRCTENMFFQEMFDRLGEDYLNFEIIELCENDVLLDREYFYINNHNGRLFNIKRREDESTSNGLYCHSCGGRLETNFRNKIIKLCRDASKNYNIENNYYNAKIIHPTLSRDFGGMCPDCMFEKMCEDKYPYIKKCKDCGFFI